MADVDVDANNEAERRTRSEPGTSMSPSSEADDDTASSTPNESPARAFAGHTLEEPPRRRAPSRRSRPVRMLQSVCRSLPLLNPRCGRPMMQAGACRIAAPSSRPAAAAAAAPSSDSSSLLTQLIASSSFGGAASSRRRLTGTLFGYRDGRVSLSLQQNARCQPTLVVELALPTHALLRELGAHAGARIVLEVEKRAEQGTADGNEAIATTDHDGWVLEELMWTMFCNGKRVGYAVRRDPTEEDIAVLETLWAVSMGGGVLPGRSDMDGPDGEMAYMRGSFEHTVGSRDSESLYMVGPPGGDCPELAIFFVRL